MRHIQTITQVKPGYAYVEQTLVLNVLEKLLGNLLANARERKESGEKEVPQT